MYPWGGKFDPDKANTTETGIGGTSAVGCFPAGASQPYGIMDLSGNVWEWTRSVYAGYPYPTDPKERRQREDLSTSQDRSRVLRGGAYWNDQWNTRCAFRCGVYPNHRDRDVGVRVVVLPKL